MTFSSLCRTAVLAMLVTALPSVRAADAAIAADLQEILDAGEVVIAVREDALPFAFVDQDGQPKGYAVDICNRIAENLRKQLNRPDLRVRYNTVTIATRALLVRERVVDMECGATSNTRARGEQFDFSVAYGIEQAELISSVKEPVSGDDLKRGARVLVSAGSTTESLLKSQAAAGGKMTVVPVRNGSRAYYEILDRKARAYAGSPEVFMGDVVRRGGDASAFQRVALEGAPSEPLAVMMRKDRPGLKKVADDTIIGLAKSGELLALHRKWFESPITTSRKTLGLSMSAGWRQMVSAPTDQPAN